MVGKKPRKRGERQGRVGRERQAHHREQGNHDAAEDVREGERDQRTCHPEENRARPVARQIGREPGAEHRIAPEPQLRRQRDGHHRDRGRHEAEERQRGSLRREKHRPARHGEEARPQTASLVLARRRHRPHDDHAQLAGGHHVEAHVLEIHSRCETRVTRQHHLQDRRSLEPSEGYAGGEHTRYGEGE